MKPHIVQQAANEFIFEFDKEVDEIEEGYEFVYDGITHKVIRAYPGILGPSYYSFLVITELVEEKQEPVL